MVIVVWDLLSDREVGRFPGERVLSFSPDEGKIAFSPFLADSPVKVTSLATGQTAEVTTIPWDAGPAAVTEPNPQQSDSVPWTVDNGRIGGAIPADGTLTLWDIERRQPVGQLEIDVEPDAATVIFDEQGRQMAVALPGGLTYLVDVDPESWWRTACEVAGRGMTTSEQENYLGSIPLPPGCP